MKKLLVLLLVAGMAISSAATAQSKVEKWKIFEVTLKGPSSGNPFTDNHLNAAFFNGKDTVRVAGFYDGKGVYKLRFMPSHEGRWTYTTSSNVKALNGKKGALLCTPAAKGNHGPVVVKDSIHFAYADGSRYCPFGTTCYAWAHQRKSLLDQTIRTLAGGYFNKMRMCIFPKSYDWNHNEPLYYPYEGTAPTNWDYTRFNPEYFRNLERCIARLDSLGIEADLIVFHPYDYWGFSKMNRTADDLYIHYIIARFAAYKNVWWSMANEYDFMQAKKPDDWNHYLETFAVGDPYHHLRSIHNGAVIFDHRNQYITHVSIQNEDTQNAHLYMQKYRKPVSYDECRYEGNINWSWGNLTGEEMVNKFWRGVMNGAYVGHGETMLTENPVRYGRDSNDELWWSKGGALRGQSPKRIKFLKDIIESAPGDLAPTSITAYWMQYNALTFHDDYYLIYFNRDQPRSEILNLPKDKTYHIDLIDAWNMTITPLEGTYSGESLVQLPGKPFTALRIQKK
jgi:hypothetical protein